MTNQSNSKTFNITVITSKTFSLIIEGFSKTTNWFLTIANLVTITANALLSLLITSSINVLTTMVVEAPLLTTKMTTSLSNLITMVSSLSVSYKVESSMSNLITMVASIPGKVNASSTINLYKILLDATVVLAVVNPLSDFDPNALSVNDTDTLGDMDYTTL